MSEVADEEDSRFDDVVDVICVGSDPGVLAYAICCAMADLDVLMVDPPAESDPQIAEFRAAMTRDLDGDVDTTDGRLPTTFLGPIAEVAPQRTSPPLEPFVGERLAQWSARCLGSPLAVLLTQVPDLLTTARTTDGESITATVIGRVAPGTDISQWLRRRADDPGLRKARHRMARIVVDSGRIAGVELADGSEVGAGLGLVFPIGPSVCEALRSDAEVEIAVVGRHAGRFARVEYIVRHDD